MGKITNLTCESLCWVVGRTWVGHPCSGAPLTWLTFHGARNGKPTNATKLLACTQMNAVAARKWEQMLEASVVVGSIVRPMFPKVSRGLSGERGQDGPAIAWKRGASLIVAHESLWALHFSFPREVEPAADLIRAIAPQRLWDTDSRNRVECEFLVISFGVSARPGRLSSVASKKLARHVAYRVLCCSQIWCDPPEWHTSMDAYTASSTDRGTEHVFLQRSLNEGEYAQARRDFAQSLARCSSGQSSRPQVCDPTSRYSKTRAQSTVSEVGIGSRYLRMESRWRFCRAHRERKERYLKGLEAELARVKQCNVDIMRERDALAVENCKLRETLGRYKAITSASTTLDGRLGESLCCDQDEQLASSDTQSMTLNAERLSLEPSLHFGASTDSSQESQGGVMQSLVDTLDYDDIGLDFVLT